MADRATEIALFRYSLIRAAADVRLSKAERGRMVRGLAGTDHVGPGGDPIRVTRGTIDRWIRDWRRGGFEALKPPARATDPRTPASVLALAEDLRRENPARTAAHITELISVSLGWSPSTRTIQRHLARVGLPRRTREVAAAIAFGRFEATRANELWVGDALHGPKVAGKAAILFAFLDDHSRALPGRRWVHAEDTLRAEAALRWGIASRGLPEAVYLDNGSPFVSSQLSRALAVLGVRLVHSRPGRPQGRGKIERFFRTVRDQFLVEVSDEIGSIQELNEAFDAWVETVYHRRVHSETGQAPLERFGTGPFHIPTPAELAEAFAWSETRTVTKTATVSLFSNLYEVDAALVGRRVELVFDPFDLTSLSVRFAGRDMGTAVPVRIGRHVHPQAKAEPETEAPVSTGISYLQLITARQEAGWDARISYAGLGPASDDDNDESEEDR